jgi:DNA-binding winged helix-turn-helix (wHTH) protein
LLPAQQLLLEGEKKVAVGARALDILITLIGRAGEVVGKADLITCVWPDTFVEESNLRVHIAGLRRALRDGQLGSRYIVNVPGRGYTSSHRSKRWMRPRRPRSLPPTRNGPAACLLP